MSASSILQLIQKRGKPVVANEPSRQTTTEKLNSSGFGNVRNTFVSHELHGSRPVDPVVARLKEKRRLENERKEAELRLKKGLAPKPAKLPKSQPVKKNNPRGEPRGDQRGNSQSQSRPRPQTPYPVAPTPTRPPSKKMNFNELMKKASSIDNSKLSISLKNKSKSKSPETVKPGSKTTRPPQEYRQLPSTVKGKNSHNGNRSHPPPQPPARLVEKRAPLPIRQPSSKLQERLGSKPKKGVPSHKPRNEYESEDNDDAIKDDDDDEDDDMDSFIASSEEEELARDSRTGPDYDRDEIWAIFNRGKKRSHFNDNDYNSDSDDMEASGSQILQEELLSRRRGEIEDKEEMENERRLAELKRARKRRS